MFDHNYPFQSVRRTTYAKDGMVATTQPLAAQAGLDILKAGGNAVDAAVAAAMSLTVLEPASNGIGGDSFAILWVDGALHGLNASGYAPQDLTIDKLKEKGLERIPQRGVIPIMVPGAPASWVALAKRFGKLPLTRLAEPAIRYAREGYPVSPAICGYWNKAIESAKKHFVGALFEPWWQTFAPGGQAIRPGQIVTFPDHADTLEAIAESDGRAFYQGDLAERIVSWVRRHDGFLGLEDMAAYAPEWVKPISVDYRGYEVWEIPPNGQGLVALEALNILKHKRFGEIDDIERYHTQFEAMKMAFEDGIAQISDPSAMRIDPNQLLAPEYGQALMSRIRPDQVFAPQQKPLTGGTVYLTTADHDGNMVSFIQSNFEDFGSGVVAPGTGVNLQNRGVSFQMDRALPNCLAPRKKTYHTIIPGFLTKGGQAVGPFGVMGAFMQPQGHVQILMNTIDFHMNPQMALDAPRWQWMAGKSFKVEPGIPETVVAALRQKGHEIEVSQDRYSFGRGQIIWRDPETGVYAGGTDSRSDGVIAAW